MPACRPLMFSLLTVLLSFQLPENEAHAQAGASQADAILGYWQRGEGEAVVEIRAHCDGYHGVIVASERHPDVVGTEIFKSLRYDPEGRLWRGRVYSMDRERDFKIQMTLPEPNRFVIRLRVLFFSRSVQFNRHPGMGVAARPPVEPRL